MKLLLLLSLLLSLSIAFCEEKAINEVDYHIFELGHLEHEFDDIASLSSEKRSLTNVVYNYLNINVVSIYQYLTNMS